MTSAELSEIEGCFQQVDLSASDSGLIDEAWTIGGGSDLEQVAIIAQFDDGTGDEVRQGVHGSAGDDTGATVMTWVVDVLIVQQSQEGHRDGQSKLL